jgi:cell division protein FtsL
VTNKQRPHREQDPRVRRSFARVLIVSGLAVVGALAVVGVRVQQVQLAYRLDALRAERAQTETLIRQLEIEIAALRAPARLEGQARQLGLVPPARHQVKLAREFVTGSTGMAAARLDRTSVDAFVR